MKIKYVIYMVIGDVMNILHITYDYPDNINGCKTVAVKNIIEGSNIITDKNFYISLNRVNNFKSEIIRFEENGIEMTTFGLPKGLFFRYTLKHSIDRVLRTKLDFKKFNLLHAHKLTFEGPISYYLYKKYGIPYIISLRQSDFKILKFKPSLKNVYKNILKNAKTIIIISPWMEKKIRMIYKSDFESIKTKIKLLPNIVETNQCYYENTSNNKYLMVLNMTLKNVKIKNIKNVFRAISQLNKQGIRIKLDIIGDGDGRKLVEKWIKKYELSESVSLLGMKKHSKIINIMKDYKCFVLCSYPETFGLVYIESLIAGIPIIYTKNTGIDGYFNNNDVGIRVNHKSVNEIKNAIKNIEEQYKYYKYNVRVLQEKKFYYDFRKDCVLRKYREILYN